MHNFITVQFCLGFCLIVFNFIYIFENPSVNHSDVGILNKDLFFPQKKCRKQNRRWVGVPHIVTGECTLSYYLVVLDIAQISATEFKAQVLKGPWCKMDLGKVFFRKL